MKHEPIGLLKEADHVLSEGCAHVTVDDSMVEGEAKAHDVPDNDLIVSYDRCLFHLVNSENGYLRIVHHRRGEEATQLA